MRGALGLVGLLVTFGVIAALWSVYHPADTVQRGQQLRPQVEQFSGRGPDQEAAIESFEIDPQHEGGRLAALRVTRVASGGAMEQFYGLQPGDRIVAFGAGGSMLAVGDHNDPDLVKAMIHDSYRYGQPIMVERGGQRLQLPREPADVASDESNYRSPMERQLDLIQRVPTH